jgi:uncharacterized SAM-binding protein YcdF (DUF218 family)
VTFRLFARRTILIPTLWGWLILVTVVFGAAGLTCRHLAAFLSPCAPVQAQFLVAEGWLPDYALEQAKTEFESKQYRLMITTGGPIETGILLSEYGTFALLARSSLIKMGVPDSLLAAVPAGQVFRDRTLASATTLKAYLDQKGIHGGTINLVSLGAHSRRSVRLFRRALGDSWRVGVISVADRSYNAQRWWRSSEGFRVVTGEAIAFLYAITAGR